jgi:hypothetical protein
MNPALAMLGISFTGRRRVCCDPTVLNITSHCIESKLSAAEIVSLGKMLHRCSASAQLIALSIRCSPHLGVEHMHLVSYT